MNRRKFFAQMRKLGFSKSRFQMTRIGLTYEKDADGNRISVTVPKHHESTFTILGDVPYSGIFVDSAGKKVNWGTPVSPNDLGLTNMLEVCLGLCNGSITYSKEY